MTAFLGLLRRELRLALRHGGDTLAVLLFFVLTAALFPLAIGPEPLLLGRLAAGAVWVCALLAALLPLLQQNTDTSWRDGIAAGLKDWWKVLEARAMSSAEPLNPQRVFWELSPRLPDNAIITADRPTPPQPCTATHSPGLRVACAVSA